MKVFGTSDAAHKLTRLIAVFTAGTFRLGENLFLIGMAVSEYENVHVAIRCRSNLNVEKLQVVWRRAKYDKKKRT